LARKEKPVAVLVKGLKNGPLEISGAVKVLDYKGKEYADAGDPVYLCRCGQQRANLPAMAATQS
jgi:hypothetical protein